MSSDEARVEVQAPDDLHVLVPVTDLAYRAGQIRAELCGPGPRELGPAAGGLVLRDAVEERGDLVVLAVLAGPASRGGPLCIRGQRLTGSPSQRATSAFALSVRVAAVLDGVPLKAGTDPRPCS